MKRKSFAYPTYGTPAEDIAAFRKKPAAHWESEGRKMAIKLFRYCAENVPAYKRMLLQKNVSASAIQSHAHFANVPIITKASYLKKYKYQDLFPFGTMPKSSTVSATSGSTGEPFFFPREEVHDAQYARSLEVLFRNQWGADVRRTLCLVGFGLGIWIGGVFTYKNLNALARKGFPLTVVPVGVHIPMLIKTFQNFAHLYDQVILMSYPPFLKDLLDEGSAKGIDWTKHKIKILTAAEGYSEKFRNYLADASGADPVRDMVNIYGTVEQGTIAQETAFGNLIRRIATDNEKLFKALFPHAGNMPTLAQYDPRHIFFEEIDGGIVATGYGSSIPLVRYSFADLGGVITYDRMMAILKEHRVPIAREIEKYGIKQNVLKLPFVYIYARSDFAIVLRGANIYPDEIRNALDSRTLRPWITGRFSAKKRETRTGNQILDLHVELKKSENAQPKIVMKILEVLIKELRARNTEFNNNYTSDPKSSTPNILLHQYRDPAYFDRAGKQRWIRV